MKSTKSLLATLAFVVVLSGAQTAQSTEASLETQSDIQKQLVYQRGVEAVLWVDAGDQRCVLSKLIVQDVRHEARRRDGDEQTARGAARILDGE